MNNNRRRLENYYYQRISENLIYLKRKEISKIAFTLSLVSLVISLSPVIGVVLLSTSKSVIFLTIIIFSNIFLIEKKLNIFKLLHPNFFNTNETFIFNRWNTYKLLSLFSVSDFLFIISTVIIISIRTIVFFSYNELLMLVASLVAIYMLLKKKQEYFFLLLSSMVLLIYVYISSLDIDLSNSKYYFSELRGNLADLEIYFIYFFISCIVSYFIFSAVSKLAPKKIFKQKKNTEKNINRAQIAFKNYISSISVLKRIMQILPVDAMIVILIFLMINVESKKEIFPILIMMITIYNTKQFITENGYFFHVFIDGKERYSFVISVKNLISIYFIKFKMILVSRLLYIFSVFALYQFNIKEVSIAQYIFIFVCIILGMIIPIFDSKLLMVNLKMLVEFNNVKYDTNFEAFIIVVLLLFSFVTHQIVIQNLIHLLVFLYIFVVLLLLTTIIVKFYLSLFSLKMWRDKLDK